jgi:hypothetical protein
VISLSSLTWTTAAAATADFDQALSATRGTGKLDKME